jgi:terminal uridylyltransferase
MRAARILAGRPERAIVALAELCEERKDEDLVSAPPYVAPRLSNLPPQTPYTVGSQSMRPKGVSAPSPERLSPTTKFFEPGPRPSPLVQHASVSSVSIRPPPEHMAPKRGKWTSPPPAEAPSADHTLFESQLGRVLQLATSSTEARETCDNNESSSNSEFLTDEDLDPLDAAESDDVTSVKSFTEGEATVSFNGNGNGLPGGPPQRRPSWHTQDTVTRAPQSSQGGQNSFSILPSSFNGSGGRVRLSRPNDTSPSPSRSEFPKRPVPGPPRARPISTWSSTSPSNTQPPNGLSIPLPLSPSSSKSSPQDSHHNHRRQGSLGESSNGATVYYQTTVPRSPRVLYPTSSFLAQYQSPHVYHRRNIENKNSNPSSNDVLPSSTPSLAYASASTIMNPRSTDAASSGSASAGPDTPTPYSSSHSHSLSSTTITAPTPPPHAPPSKLAQAVSTRNTSNGTPLSVNPNSNSSTLNSNYHARSRSRSRSKSPRRPPQYQFFHPHTLQLDIDPLTPNNTDNTPSSPQPSSGSSPTPSTSTGYATSVSRSPSPVSPAPLTTASPFTVQGQAKGLEKETVKKKRLVFGSACVPDFEQPTSAEA